MVESKNDGDKKGLILSNTINSKLQELRAMKRVGNNEGAAALAKEIFALRQELKELQSTKKGAPLNGSPTTSKIKSKFDAAKLRY